LHIILKKHIDIIPKLIENYNNNDHWSINVKPNDAFNDIEKFYNPLLKIMQFEKINSNFSIGEKKIKSCLKKKVKIIQNQYIQ